MRSLLLVLVLLNLLFFGLQLEVFGDVVHTDREPQRMAQQNADRIRILREAP